MTYIIGSIYSIEHTHTPGFYIERLLAYYVVVSVS